MIRLPRHHLWIFDCDGVLLDSNRIKNEAFRELSQPWGDDIAERLVERNRGTGGVSRFVKIRHFVEEILGQRGNETLIEELIVRYGELVRRRLFDAPVIAGVEGLLASLPSSAVAFVVSGGLQDEVREALVRKGLASRFSGIYGSPRPKDAILSMIRKEHGDAHGVYFGDARHDMEVARRFGLDFVFVAGVSDDPDVACECENVVVDLTGVTVDA